MKVGTGNKVLKFWNRLFLDERPSIGLSFFRIFAALTTGFHVLPLLFRLEDNFLSNAFREANTSFFTIEFLKLVYKSPDSLVVFFAALFCLSWFAFLIGLRSQISCIVMTACCYYFYALNSYFIGTLSWDILLVTLFLMCITPYHGDYFSVDSLFDCCSDPYKRLRPYFLQRLLQMQIASTFFYTALYKTTGEGNWITGNPLYYLMNMPASGVMKHFMLKEWLAMHPTLCYVIGISIVVTEFLLGFLLFIPRTRISAVYAGIFFHIVLILTMDVPAIFFFLFPAQLTLFINPQDIVRWIEHRRVYHAAASRLKLIYDGHCGFCRASVRQLKVMDLFNKVEYVDFQAHPDLSELHPQLNKKTATSRIHLIEPPYLLGEEKKLYAGFFVFRRLSFVMPMLWPMVLVLYAPGSGLIGPLVYQWVADHRYLFHLNKTCRENACYR